MTSREIFRDRLLKCLREELVGPLVDDAPDVIQESPAQRYCAGILFPPKRANTELEQGADDSMEDADVEAPIPHPDGDGVTKETGMAFKVEDDGAWDESVRLANTFLPSAMGISFVATPSRRGLVMQARAATYASVKPESEESKLREWHGRLLDLPPAVFVPSGTKPREMQAKELAPRLEARALFRKRPDGSFLVTMAIVNKHSDPGDGPPAAKECFFRAGFTVRDAEGGLVFSEYQKCLTASKDPEVESFNLLYRNIRNFAVGHGCAPEWGEDKDGWTDFVATESVPTYKVPPIEAYSGGGKELSMSFLAGEEGSSDPEIVTALGDLAASYRNWIADLEKSVPNLPESLRGVANRHIGECRTCHARIEAGIRLLSSDPKALRAFKLANLAMLIQQQHSKRARRTVSDQWVALPTRYVSDDKNGRWRCFQLAFILMNLQAFLPAPEGRAAREVVDLIWFPTGGGKTESYLGLSAFAIFMRRLVRPGNDGCTVLMRYTLRLLTAQQFQRASAMICACETIRQESKGDLGDSAISIGLWVGQSLSPNTREEAIRAVNAMVGPRRRGAGGHGDPQATQLEDNPFQILKCPWCGTAMDDPSALGYVTAANPRRVKLVCPEKRCPFSSRRNPLPVHVVDEDIYEERPSLVIGTVDKFAMLAWREQAGALFGLGARECDPPDLIIQDELHLISGPLGSVVGLYETVIDLMASRLGTPPKIVASTATIRRAANQCKGLYDRAVFQFPPPGLEIGDSFFARQNDDAPGRVYAGVFATGAPSFITAQIRALGAILQACKYLDLPPGSDESVRDPYWTLLEYFNSLRELGHAATLVQADIPEYMWAIASRSKLPKEKVRNIGSPVELTSRRTAKEIPEILERLERRYPSEGDGPRPLDTLLATNMISVGVDVPRLGLMAVIGQPKTTSEYIQASSRVGRSADVPGLILALYNTGKPRDRSHFEHFRSYHAAFYRFVEPTSVTPFSIPVLERALHSLLVITARHLDCIDSPSAFTGSGTWLSRFLDHIKKRSERVDSEHSIYLVERLRNLIIHWSRLRPGEWGRFGQPPEGRPLMFPAGSEPRKEWQDLAWPTPSSMRNVDVECVADVIAQFPDPMEENDA